MEDLLKKESVKRVNDFIKQFDSSLEIIVLDKTARTAKDAATVFLHRDRNRPSWRIGWIAFCQIRRSATSCQQYR